MKQDRERKRRGRKRYSEGGRVVNERCEEKRETVWEDENEK